MYTELKTIDGETLMSTPLVPIRFIVDQLLPQGLHILAGAPKAGKSWLALWLCLQVAKGESVWSFQTEKRTSLYLCLEDSMVRIQNRLFYITDDAPENVHFATLSSSIGDGLEQQIESFVAAHPGTGLIVIDTLQKVRQVSNDNAYASDYRDIGVLKAVADKLGIAILLIHHLRKQRDSDPFNMVSGTTGITGAVDGSFVLERDKRSSDEATLYCTGRDIEYRELKISFRSHLWHLLADSVETPETLLDNTIFLLSVFMKEQLSFTGTATELSAELEKHTGEEVLPNVLMKKMMRNQSELLCHGISFTTKRTHDRKEIHLKYECVDCVGNDGKTGTISVPDLPTQPSLPTQEAG